MRLHTRVATPVHPFDVCMRGCISYRCLNADPSCRGYCNPECQYDPERPRNPGIHITLLPSPHPLYRASIDWISIVIGEEGYLSDGKDE
jgi:hypothetical protein